eukprot:COSAG02_NODE_156_length_33065_cov_17.208336_7_plen_153_part_00
MESPCRPLSSYPAPVRLVRAQRVWKGGGRGGHEGASSPSSNGPSPLHPLSPSSRQTPKSLARAIGQDRSAAALTAGRICAALDALVRMDVPFASCDISTTTTPSYSKLKEYQKLTEKYKERRGPLLRCLFLRGISIGNRGFARWACWELDGF